MMDAIRIRSITSFKKSSMLNFPYALHRILCSFEGKYFKTKEISSSCDSQFWEDFDQTNQVTLERLQFNCNIQTENIYCFQHAEFLQYQYGRCHWRRRGTGQVMGEVILSVLSLVKIFAKFQMRKYMFGQKTCKTHLLYQTASHWTNILRWSKLLLC